MVDILSVSCQTPSNQFDITQFFLFIVAHIISRITCYENSFFSNFSAKNNKISRELLKVMKKKTMLKAGEHDFHSSSDST